jgi:ATP synthase regulation protein NCA2
VKVRLLSKEMMNALYAMDEMMSANDINMNIAAVTPGLVLGYFAYRVFRFCTYALLKLGTSREETYASFRNVLADIERLLIMRDNPPHSYSSSWNTLPNTSNIDPMTYRPYSVLESDDLGMLMLLIHECRSIMWQNKRRFSHSVTRSVSEDLSELAGERGKR